jgi:hypothetical protein
MKSYLHALLPIRERLTEISFVRRFSFEWASRGPPGGSESQEDSTSRYQLLFLGTITPRDYYALGIGPLLGTKASVKQKRRQELSGRRRFRLDAVVTRSLCLEALIIQPKSILARIGIAIDVISVLRSGRVRTGNIESRICSTANSRSIGSPDVRIYC